MAVLDLTIDASGAIEGAKKFEKAIEDSKNKNEKNVKEISKSFINIESSLGKTITSLSGLWKKFYENQTFYLAAAGTAAIALGASITKTTAAFDNELRLAASTAQATAAEFENMSNAARAAGIKLGFASKSSAEVLTNLASAGFSATDAIAGMPKVIELASANQLQLADSSVILAGSMRGFGLEIQDLTKVSDVLTKTSFITNANVTYLGEAFRTAAPSAKAAGESIEAASAVIGALANNMITASSAGQAYKRLLLSLQAPTDESARALRELGVSTIDSEGGFRKLSDILSDLKEKSIGVAEAEKIFGAYTMTAGLIAINASDDIKKFEKSITDSAGATAEATKFIKGGLGGSLEKAGAAVESLAISFGQRLAPLVKTAADMLAEYAVRSSQATEKTFGLSDAVQGTANFFAYSKLIIQGLVLGIEKLVETISVATLESIDTLSNITGIAPLLKTLFDIDISKENAGLVSAIKGIGDEFENSYLKAENSVSSLNRKFEEFDERLRKNIEASERSKSITEDLARAEEQLAEKKKLSAEFSGTVVQDNSETVKNLQEQINLQSNLQTSYAEVSAASGKAAGSIQTYNAELENISENEIAINVDSFDKSAETIKNFAESAKSAIADLTSYPVGFDTTGIDSYNQKIKDLQRQVEEAKGSFSGNLKINFETTGTESLQQQIALLQQQKLQIDGLVPSLENVDGVWRQIPSSIATSVEKAVFSVGDLLNKSGEVETTWKNIDGVWTEVLSNGAVVVDNITQNVINATGKSNELAGSFQNVSSSANTMSSADLIIDGIKSKLLETGVSAEEAARKLNTIADTQVALQKTKDRIQSLEEVIKKVQPASEAGKIAIKEMLQNEAIAEALTAKISKLKEEIYKTGEEFTKTNQKTKGLKEADDIISKVSKSLYTAGLSAKDLKDNFGKLTDTSAALTQTENLIASLKDSIEQVGVSSTEGKEKLKKLFDAEQTAEILRKKIEEIKDGIYGTGAAADTAASSIAKMTGTADSAAKSAQNIATAAEEIASSSGSFNFAAPLLNTFDAIDERIKSIREQQEFFAGQMETIRGSDIRGRNDNDDTQRQIMDALTEKFRIIAEKFKEINMSSLMENREIIRDQTTTNNNFTLYQTFTGSTPDDAQNFSNDLRRLTERA